MKNMLLICICTFLAKPNNLFSQNEYQDSSLVANYFIMANLGAGFPVEISEQGVSAVNTAQYIPCSYDTGFGTGQSLDFDSYFESNLSGRISAGDSLLGIVQGVYKISNYGWGVGGDNIFKNSYVMEQYRLMRDGESDATCENFSVFCANVCEYYGFPAVVLNTRIYGSNGDGRGHTFPIARTSDGVWFVLETTTGQMIQNQGSLISYQDLLLSLDEQNVDWIETTEPVTGKVVSPAPGILEGFQWPFGETLPSINMVNNIFILSSSRTLESWVSNHMIDLTYLTYLENNGFGRNWLYMYNHILSESMDGEPSSVSLFDEILTITSSQSNSVKDFTIYPNPTSGIVKFSKPISFSVYDIKGDLVKKSDKEVGEVSLKGCPSGMYLIKIQEGNKTTRKRIILLD